MWKYASSAAIQSQRSQEEDGVNAKSEDNVSKLSNLFFQAAASSTKQVQGDDELEALRRRDSARQRWKILCLVRTADSSSAEEVRQERLKDRVDEWMSNFMTKLRLAQQEVRITKQAEYNREEEGDAFQGDSSFRDSGLDLDSGIDFATTEISSTSELEKSFQNEMRRSRAREKRKHEHEQKKRIKQREENERERERLLILDGKVKPSKQQQLQDPIVKLHQNLLHVDRDRHRRATRSASPSTRKSANKSPRPKRKTSKRRAKSKDSKATLSTSAAGTTSSANLKWWKNMSGDVNSVQSVYQNGHRRTIDFHNALEDNTETVIASLVYDEDMDKLVETSTDPVSNPSISNGCGDIDDGNPVFQAFERAKNVDDLYKIAEIWVNPIIPYIAFEQAEEEEDDGTL